ncbi:MAG: hypothetical protein SangKO_099970 [Sandaracinaceae bacterium]
MGLVKVKAIRPESVLVEAFHGADRVETLDVHPASLAAATPAAQTRCYVEEDDDRGGWTAGRWLRQVGTQVEVAFPGRRVGYVAEQRVTVRSARRADPVATLAARAHETAYFHRRRALILAGLAKQRAAARGFTGALSASITLYPHQFEVVRRVLTDPVQRYLLADEVGLGKTIEAAVIIRQHLLDHPQSRVLVTVPPPLVAQWRYELDRTVDAFAEPDRVLVVSTDDLPNVPPDGWGLAVVDEAHRVTAEAYREGPSGARYAALEQIARRTPKLLLLSATPARGNEDEFLAMLHLLDPEAFSLNEQEAFRKRVDERAQIGRLLMAIPKASAGRAITRIQLDHLADAFADDPTLLALIQEARSANALDVDREDALAPALRRVESHVRETYRLHQRLLRSRRDAVPGLIGRGGADEARAVGLEYGMDDRDLDAAEALESWRLAAARHASATGRTGAYAGLYVGLVELAGSDLLLLRAAAGARLHARPDPDLPSPLAQLLLGLDRIPGETEPLELLAALPDDAEEDRLDLLAMVVEGQPEGTQVVAFFSHTTTAHRAAERLRSVLGPHAVATHVRNAATADRDAERDRFEADPTVRVLVGDQSMEEGLNLQHAHLLIHGDLPLNPNRLEQRAGRLDRIGRREPMKTRVLLGHEDLSDSVDEAWMVVCRDAFGLFRRSVSEFQFYIDETLPRLHEVAFTHGARGLRDASESIRSGLGAEAQRIAEQDALDALATDSEARAAVQALREQDPELARRLHADVDAWCREVLQLEHHPETQYQLATWSLVPSDVWLNRLLPHLAEAATYDRDEAVATGARLLRLGHPFIDALAEYLEWDDRGQAYAFWRTDSTVQEGRGVAWAGFRFDVKVDAYVDPSLVSGRLDLPALQRRADALFGPALVPVHVGFDGRVLQDPDVLTRLRRGFDKDRGDINLHKGRERVLNEFVDPEEWEGRCHEAGEIAMHSLRLDDDLSKRSERARTALDDVAERRQTRLSLRAARTGDSSQEAALDAAATEALRTALARPRLCIEAAGALVLASFSPDEL